MSEEQTKVASKGGKPIPPKPTFVRPRAWFDEQIEKCQKSVSELAMQEHLATLNGNHEDVLLCRERRYSLHSHINALQMATTEDKK